MPENETEKALTEIWSEVLDIAPPGVHANFFGLGGDSLKAIRVAARAAKRGLHAPVGLILTHPTVAGIAKAVSKTLPVDQTPCGSDNPRSEAAEYPLTATQAGMLFHTASTRTAALPVAVCFLSFGCCQCSLRAACEAVVQRHPALRTSFAYRGETGEPFQTVAQQVLVPFRYIDLREHAEADVEGHLQEYLARDRASPFRVDHPPLIRFSLLQTDPSRFARGHHAFTPDYGRMGSSPTAARDLYGLQRA